MEGCGLHQPEDSQPSVLGGLIMGPNPELFCSHRRYVREGGARAYRTRQGRKIAQVFSVGDFGLFLSESDWDFFTGPSRHKHPDWWLAEIRKAWTPVAVAAGNDWRQSRAMAQAYTGFGYLIPAISEIS